MRTSCLALAAAVALVLPAGAAAPKPQIVDPVGDALPGASSGYDVVSALFSTTGTRTKAGRTNVYTPTKLVVTLTYAGEVPPDVWSAQVVTFDAPGCAAVYLERFNGVAYGRAGCFTHEFAFDTRAAGRTLTFTLPFTTIGKERLRKGAALTKLRTYTAVGEPVFGYETGDVTGGSFGLGFVDHASTQAPYVVG